MTHPHRLHATTALHSLRRAISYLPAARDAALISRPQLGPRPTRPRSLAALRAHDDLIRQERRDRAQNIRQGIKPAAATPAPIAPSLLDIEADLATGIHDITLLIASALRRNPDHNYRTAREAIAAAGLSGRCEYIAAALPHVPPHLARDIHDHLDHLDHRLRTILGLDADRWTLPGAPACPACGRRTLAAQTSAVNSADWTITCESCACHGPLCSCAMTSRPAGTRHIWPATTPLIHTALETLATAA